MTDLVINKKTSVVHAVAAECGSTSGTMYVTVCHKNFFHDYGYRPVDGDDYPVSCVNCQRALAKKQKPTGKDKSTFVAVSDYSDTGFTGDNLDDILTILREYENEYDLIDQLENDELGWRIFKAIPIKVKPIVKTTVSLEGLEVTED